MLVNTSVQYQFRFPDCFWLLFQCWHPRTVQKDGSESKWEIFLIFPAKSSSAFSEEPVFLYTFEHWNPETLGIFLSFVPLEGMNYNGIYVWIKCFPDVTHACELFYLFKHALFGAVNPEVTETEQRVIDQFTTAFTNFAKFGSVVLFWRYGTVSLQEPEWHGQFGIARSLGSDYEGELWPELRIRNRELCNERTLLWGEIKSPCKL